MNGRVAALTFDNGTDVKVERHLPTSKDDDAARYDVPRSGWPQSSPALSPKGAADARSSAGTVPSSGRPAPAQPAARRATTPTKAPPPLTPPRDGITDRPKPVDASPPAGLADSDVLADIQSIVGAASAKPSSAAVRSSAPTPNRNRVFDELAASMSHARSYDLGSLQLEQRFDDFDRHADRTGDGTSRSASDFAAPDPATFAGTRQSPSPSKAPHEPPEVEATPGCGCGGQDGCGTNGATTADFVTDLDLMAQQADNESEIPLDPGVGGRSVGESALEAGDIILSTTDHPMSKTIRDLTSSEVSHAALYIGDGKVVEAIEGGVLLRSMDTALDDDSLAVAYRHRDMTPVKAARIAAFLTDHARKKTPFDTWGLIQVAPGQLARAICNQLEGAARRACIESAGRLRVGTNDDNAFFCSELVLTALAEAGLALSDTAPSWSSPQQIVELNHNGLLDYVGHLKG